LKELALSKGVEIRLGCKVVGVDVEKAEIELESGEKFSGDLVVAADGIHSVVRRVCVGEESRSKETSADVYRWLLDTKTVIDDRDTRQLLRDNSRTMFAVPYKETKLLFVWYSCRNGEVQNFGIVCPSKEGEYKAEDYGASADKAAVLEMCSSFHPYLRKLIEMAETIKAWRIHDRAPLPTYAYGSTLLVGDAAHPMLPLNAQAGNQALEDAGALLSLFSNLKNGSREEIRERMKLFDALRLKRTGRQQIISSVMPDEVKNLGERLKGYEEDIPGEEGESARERMLRELGYNIFARSEEVLKGSSDP